MSDESFFREVNEEIRHDRTRQLWSRFGKWLLGAAVLAVLVTIGVVLWNGYRERQANASGDRYLAALDMARSGDLDGAIAGLDALAKDGFGAYPDLARLRLAAAREAKGDAKGAVEAFDAVAADEDAPSPLRDLAAVRAAYVLVDTGTLEDVRKRVERLSGDAEPLRHTAREALGLAAWRSGDAAGAKALFEKLRDDAATPSGVALRTRVMLEVIVAGGTYVAPSPSPGPAPAAPDQPAPVVLPMPDDPLLGAPAIEGPGEGAPADPAPAPSQPPAAPAPRSAPATPAPAPAPAANP